MVLKPEKSDFQKAPQTNGVYIFLSGTTPVYIGKSIHLKARLVSHAEAAAIDAKERRIFESATSVRIIETDSEFSALLLEARLIRRYMPKYNVIWKDDKSYLYIKITSKDTYPRIRLVRKGDEDPLASYYGPFPSGRIAERLLREMRKVIPYCSQKEIGPKPCFHNKIGLCDPCPNAIEALPEGAAKRSLVRKYRANMRAIERILEGKPNPVIKGLYDKLKILASEERYEDALKLRNRIFSFEEFISHGLRTEREIANIGKRGESAADLKKLLAPHFAHLEDLHRIECYDISNLSQKDATAAMVVATDGSIDKSQYRKFRIKNPALRSDFQMLRETLTRRLANDWPLPQIFVVDGGKPQVRTFLAVLQELGFSHIPAVGIAKNPDRLVIGAGELPTIRPSLRSPGFNLVRSLRDESHRFSKKYHLLLRSRKLIPED